MFAIIIQLEELIGKVSSGLRKVGNLGSRKSTAVIRKQRRDEKVDIQ